jgi:AcrR family transcriptional regulator
MTPVLHIVSSARGRPRTDGLRERILAVAERIFRERPFHEVRMDDVARKSGVAKGTLYLYFAGKRELYLAVLFEGMEQLRRALAAVATAPAQPLDRLRGTVSCFLEHLWRRRAFFGLLLRHDLQLEPHETRQWLRRRERLSAVVRSTIAGAIDTGQLRRIAPDVGEEMLLGIVRGVHVARHAGANAGRVEEAMDLFLHGTAAPARRCVVRRKTAR